MHHETRLLRAQAEEITARLPDIGVAVEAAHIILDGLQHSSPVNAEMVQEAATARQLAEQYGVTVRIIPNGDTGLVVRFANDIPAKGSLYTIVEQGDRQVAVDGYGKWPWSKSMAPVVAVDADDTIFGYTASKGPRQEKYDEHARELLAGIDQALLKDLMTITDKFSRWQVDGDELYHRRVHQQTLEWATSEMIRADLAGDAEAAQAKVREIERQLEAVTNRTSEIDAPFQFEGDRLVARPQGLNGLDLSSVFEPVFEPAIYDDTISALQTIARENARVVGFTLGETDFQFEKVLRLHKRLTEAGQPWPFTDFFLTKRPKGVFLERLLATAQTDPIIKENFFSDDPHVFMLVDDDTRQLESFLSQNETVSAASGARLAAIRSTRSGTKNQKRSWEADIHDPQRRDYNPEERLNALANGYVSSMTSSADLTIQYFWMMQGMLSKLGDTMMSKPLQRQLGLQLLHNSRRLEVAMDNIGVFEVSHLLAAHNGQVEAN